MSEDTQEILLTAKQERFCYEYCLDFNATQAAIRAGYSKQAARAIASENLSKPNIQEKIKELQDNLSETAGISRLRVLKEHMKLAFSSIAHLHNTWIQRKEFDELSEDQKACISEISTQIRTIKLGENESADVEFIKIKLFDKQKSLEAISRMLGFDEPSKIHLGIDTNDLPNIIIKRHGH